VPGVGGAQGVRHHAVAVHNHRRSVGGGDHDGGIGLGCVQRYIGRVELLLQITVGRVIEGHVRHVAAAQAADDLARARADLYNLQQEYQGFVRRSREGAASHRDAGAAGVVEALIPVLDEIELARQHGDLTGTFETTAGKLESILTEKYSLERFGAVGEVFDPTLHEALMATESSEVTEPTIAAVLQPGYRLGERVVRAARVQVANPA